MAFLSSTLAVVSACDKTPPPQLPPTDVSVGDPDSTGSIPKEVPAPTPEPIQAKVPARPDTAVTATDCEPDRAAMQQLKKAFDEIHTEIESLYAALPGGCSVSDDACEPKYKPIAKRFHDVQERARSLSGLCDCSAPIVAEYRSKQRASVNTRLGFIRDRIIALGGGKAPAEEKWQALLRNEATPRPCLSCVMCEPKSACD